MIPLEILLFPSMTDMGPTAWFKGLLFGIILMTIVFALLLIGIIPFPFHLCIG